MAIYGHPLALCPGTVPSSPGAGARKVGGAEGGGGSVRESEDLLQDDSGICWRSSWIYSGLMGFIVI
jgi:hypothetical protein